MYVAFFMKHFVSCLSSGIVQFRAVDFKAVMRHFQGDEGCIYELIKGGSSV